MSQICTCETMYIFPSSHFMSSTSALYIGKGHYSLEFLWWELDFGIRAKLCLVLGVCSRPMVIPRTVVPTMRNLLVSHWVVPAVSLKVGERWRFSIPQCLDMSSALASYTGKDHSPLRVQAFVVRTQLCMYRVLEFAFIGYI